MSSKDEWLRVAKELDRQLNINIKKGGEKMNISKVYYEELKSKCVNGKWESVRIGAEVEVGDYGTETICLSKAKDFVKDKLNKACGYDSKDNVNKTLAKEIYEDVKELLTML